MIACLGMGEVQETSFWQPNHSSRSSRLITGDDVSSVLWRFQRLSCTSYSGDRRDCAIPEFDDLRPSIGDGVALSSRLFVKAAVSANSSNARFAACSLVSLTANLLRDFGSMIQNAGEREHGIQSQAVEVTLMGCARTICLA